MKSLKKNMTLDGLAIMVAKGFENTATKHELEKVKIEVVELSRKVGGLDHKVEALNSNVKNYLALSEKRYFELKQRDALLAQWIKRVAEKTKVPIDVSQLEKI